MRRVKCTSIDYDTVFSSQAKIDSGEYFARDKVIAGRLSIE
jgi:hypothetical protein